VRHSSHPFLTVDALPEDLAAMMASASTGIRIAARWLSMLGKWQRAALPMEERGAVKIARGLPH
jgi:hypothetical protein